MNWILKKFEELTVDDLYAILRLRNEVFVVEQQCVYMDTDNKDQQALHFMGWDNDELVAYTRIIPPGIFYPESSIGRVVTAPSARGRGMGKELMEQTLQQISNRYGNTPVRIGAQLYLKDFYSSLGFQQTSEPYLEDGIEHIEMIRS